MKEENKDIFILYRLIFFIALFIISVGMFKYFQKELMDFIPDLSFWFEEVGFIDNVVMILFLFIMMICSSIFNISTRKKSNSVVGRILLLIGLCLIIVLNFILYYIGFYEFSIVEDFDVVLNVPSIPGRYDSYLTDIIFFIGETITFFSILVEVFLELIEKEHILRVVNTCIFVLLITVFSCILPGILVVPNLLLLSIGAFLSVILLFIRRNSKPIKMLEVMILFMIFIIVCLCIYGIIADYYYFMIS